MDDWKKIIKEYERYKNFTILDKPVKFRELFHGKDIETVQLHSIEVINIGFNVKGIIGFSGVFSWKNDTIESIDHDSYTDMMLVYGYELNNDILDILVKDW